MLHKEVALDATPTTDQGEFSAIAAAYSVDRTNERIVKGAFADTIAKWRASKKMVPVHWNHAKDAADVIGSVDPASMEERSDGLYVEGTLDITESTVAREAWRSMKGNRISLSFGYMVLEQEKASDGVLDLLELDLFEVSLAPAPANPDTRILSMKSTDDDAVDPVLAAFLRSSRARTKAPKTGTPLFDAWLAEQDAKALPPKPKRMPVRVKTFEID